MQVFNVGAFNILQDWSWGFYRNKGLCHGCRSHWFWFGLQHELFHMSFEQLRYCVSVQDTRACLVYEYTGTVFTFCFQLTTCTCGTAQWLKPWWYWLNLLTDSRRTSPETQTQIRNLLRQQPYSTKVVHCLQRVYCGLMLMMRQPWQNSCSHSSHPITTQCTRNTTYEISKKMPNQNSIDIPMQISKALFAANSKLSRNAHLVRLYPELDWRWARKVCSFLQSNKWNNYLLTVCVII